MSGEKPTYTRHSPIFARRAKLLFRRRVEYSPHRGFATFTAESARENRLSFVCSPAVSVRSTSLDALSSFASDLRGPAKNRDPRAIGRIADALFFREDLFIGTCRPETGFPVAGSKTEQKTRRREKSRKKREHRVRMAYI